MSAATESQLFNMLRVTVDGAGSGRHIGSPRSQCRLICAMCRLIAFQRLIWRASSVVMRRPIQVRLTYSDALYFALSGNGRTTSLKPISEQSIYTSISKCLLNWLRGGPRPETSTMAG